MNETLKSYLVNELRAVAERMAARQDVDSLYFFSAVFGAAQRVFNIEPLPHVLHLYVVSSWAHGQLNGRLQVEQQPGLPQTTPRLPEGTFEKLSAIVEELAGRIQADQDFNDLLTEMCRVAYASTGNGYYLYQLGRL